MRTTTAIVILASLLASSGSADPRAPVTIVPAADAKGELFDPATVSLDRLPVEYVQEEYLVSGTVDVYRYGDPPVLGEKFVRDDVETSYTTRFVIKRPADPAHFRGTVVVEWWNSTATFDTAPVFDPSAEFFARSGWIYIGVTNSPDAINYLVGSCSLFGLVPPTCGTRYEDLFMPERGQAYEAVSQIVTLLRSASPDNPLYPAFHPVERLYHAGQSQQGGSIVTYANEFHFEHNDGYFIQASGSRARNLSTDSPIPEPGQPGRMVRTDLAVPIIRAQTETDVSGVLAAGSRQQDAGAFRYYEMPGTAHVTVHKDICPIPAGIVGPEICLEDLCLEELNTLADGPVFGKYLYNAMWRNLDLYSRLDVPMPHGDLITSQGDQMVRDVFGNALGGIRLPDVSVPTATYTGRATSKLTCGEEGALPEPDCLPPTSPLALTVANLFCGLSGTTTTFDKSLIDTLYPSHRDYVRQVVRRTRHLRRARFLTGHDAQEIIRRAAASDIGEVIHPPKRNRRR